MKLPYFLIVIWAALPLAAMEQEFRFLPDGAGWFVHGNYPTEVPIRYWFQPGSDGRAMRIRAEWNRHENSIICRAELVPGEEYSISGRWRALTGSERLRISTCFLYNLPGRREKLTQQKNITARSMQHVPETVQMPPRDFAAPVAGEWQPLSLVHLPPRTRRCRECGRLLQPEQIRVTLTIFAPDDRQLKRPMELEVSDLKLSGPDTIVLSADFGKVVRDKLFETPPPSPSNAFDGRSLRQASAGDAAVALAHALLTPEQRIERNPAFTLRLLQYWPNAATRKIRRALRFPPPVPEFGPFFTATVRDGKFFGIRRNGRSGELVELTPGAGRWRTVWRNPNPDTPAQISYEHQLVPLNHAGSVIWSAYGGIPVGGGVPAPLPFPLRKPPVYAILDGEIYTKSSSPTQLRIHAANRRESRTLQLKFSPLAGASVTGLWSDQKTGKLLLKLSVSDITQFYETDPKTGACRLKYRAAGPCDLIDTPFGRFADSSRAATGALAFDPGIGKPFLLLSGAPERSLGLPSLPRAAQLRLPAFCRPVGLKGGYLLLRSPAHQLLALNLNSPKQSLQLQHLPFQRLHAGPNGAVWIEAEDGLYEVAPRDGWGTLPALREAVSEEELLLKRLNAEILPLEQALQRTYMSDADLFAVRKIRKGERQVLEFSAGRFPFECRIALQFNPELVRGRSLRLFFQPESVARRLPALQIGEGVEHGFPQFPANGIVTLRTGTGLLELHLQRSDQPVTFTLDSVLLSKEKEFRQ